MSEPLKMKVPREQTATVTEALRADDRWTPVPPDCPECAPEHPGTYVFTSGEYTIYVGSSNNLQRRLSEWPVSSMPDGHWDTPWGAYSYFHGFSLFIRCSEEYGDWLMWEAQLIRALKPTMNKRVP